MKGKERGGNKTQKLCTVYSPILVGSIHVLTSRRDELLTNVEHAGEMRCKPFLWSFVTTISVSWVMDLNNDGIYSFEKSEIRQLRSIAWPR